MHFIRSEVTADRFALLVDRWALPDAIGQPPGRDVQRLGQILARTQQHNAGAGLQQRNSRYRAVGFPAQPSHAQPFRLARQAEPIAHPSVEVLARPSARCRLGRRLGVQPEPRVPLAPAQVAVFPEGEVNRRDAQSAGELLDPPGTGPAQLATRIAERTGWPIAAALLERFPEFLILHAHLEDKP